MQDCWCNLIFIRNCAELPPLNWMNRHAKEKLCIMSILWTKLQSIILLGTADSEYFMPSAITTLNSINNTPINCSCDYIMFLVAMFLLVGCSLLTVLECVQAVETKVLQWRTNYLYYPVHNQCTLMSTDQAYRPNKEKKHRTERWGRIKEWVCERDNRKRNTAKHWQSLRIEDTH